jgi:serine protease Do
VKKRLLLAALVALFAFSLTACSLSSFVSSVLEGSDDSATAAIDLSYGLTADELAAYADTTDAALVVAGIVMPATVEVTVNISYSYTKTVLGPGWSPSTSTGYGTATSVATGFFVNADGYLVTNAHVVTLEDYESYSGFAYEGWEITVAFADSDVDIPCSIVTYDSDLDLAVLKTDVSIEDLAYAVFYDLTDPTSDAYDDADAVRLLYGEPAIAVGNAYGYGISVTEGVVSAPVRFFEDGSDVIQAIQTDAAINEGNSGGPLCNAFGAVIGINSFKIVSDTSESLGFAIPSNIVIDYLESVGGITFYTTSVRAFTSADVVANVG